MTPSQSGKGQKMAQPDIHFTASKQPWVILPPDTPTVEAHCRQSEFSPAESPAPRGAWIAGLDAVSPVSTS